MRSALLLPAVLVAVASVQAADVDFFESKVRPLFAARCYSCHSAQAKKLKGGLRLDSPAAIRKGGDSGPVVVPGEPDKSLLVRALRYDAESVQMPPNGKLPQREVAVLTDWVRRGAPLPADAPVAAARAVDRRIEEGRKFWSFQPPREATPPACRKSSWPQRRIDAFLLAETEKRGLSPSAAADRRTLIRRVTYDVIGLPPTPQEVEAFVNDKRVDAYERLVERLLGSPQHGERWGRFWLDLVRYCDVAEPWVETKGQPYLYRDWVTAALNADLPFDQFVMRQLAADAMPECGPGDLAALGMLGLAPVYWKELKLDKDVIKTVVAEEWEEQIHTLSGAVLGLTVACARCHDHKFDPIAMEDYYGLAGVFASIRPKDRALLPTGQARVVEQAHQEVQKLRMEIEKLQQTKPLPADGKQKIAECKSRIEKIEKGTPHYQAPVALAVEDSSLYVLADGPHRTKLEYKAAVAQDVAVQIRGNPANVAALAPRRFLAALSPAAPPAFKQGSGRLDLARTLVREGAPLTARVIVNRVWKHHFGAGLVDTPSNFGSQGSRPSHPALLDDLTARFIAHGWSLKWLHREILLSAAYRQASAHDDAKHAIDPDNRWLWRMNRRRLEVEAWRDGMLAATGTLVGSVGGPPQDLGDPKNFRRTLYATIKRRELHDMLRLHDFPDPIIHSPGRDETTTPLQQLFVLNSPFIEAQAAALVQRLKSEAPTSVEQQIRRAYLLLYSRPPSDGQVRLGTEYLSGGSKPADDAVWRQYAQALLGSNEFFFVD